MSLPGSPYIYRRNSRGSQYWRKPPVPSAKRGHAIDRLPLVHHTLENIPLPFADDSAAVTPSSEDLSSYNLLKNIPNGRQFSFASQKRNTVPHPEVVAVRHSGSRRSSYASNYSRASRKSRGSQAGDKSKLETLLNFKKGKVPDVILDKSKLDDDVRKCCVFYFDLCVPVKPIDFYFPLLLGNVSLCNF